MPIKLVRVADNPSDTVEIRIGYVLLKEGCLLVSSEDERPMGSQSDLPPQRVPHGVGLVPWNGKRKKDLTSYQVHRLQC